MLYSKEEFDRRLKDGLSQNNLTGFDKDLSQKLYTITQRLDECGKQFNLTAITDPEEVLQKHLLDCLFAADTIRGLCSAPAASCALLDVGSGAGFPSLPIAAALPALSVHALDSTAKKVNYMNETAALGGIVNFSAFTARAEEAARTPALREHFDFVSARAVARLNVLLELCTPFLHIGGYFIAMKGAAAEEEAKEACRAASLLGCTLSKIVPYSLTGHADQRFLLIYQKNSPASPTYPRNFSQISKKPL